MPASNTIEIILQGVDNATEVMTRISDYLDTTGRRITSIGAGLTALTAPLAIGLGAATQQALAFDPKPERPEAQDVDHRTSQ